MKLASLSSSRQLLAAVTTFAMFGGLTTTGWAGAKDYELQAVSADIKAAHDATLAVRLVNRTTGKPVEGAVVFRSRLDMSPDGMADMTTTVAPIPGDEPGIYRFKADLSMVGGWALNIMAKVPGEAETVEGSVVFKAKE